MTEEFITLSHQEFDRLCIIQATISKKHSQQKAAMRLGISTRQMETLRQWMIADELWLVKLPRKKPAFTSGALGGALGAQVSEN